MEFAKDKYIERRINSKGKNGFIKWAGNNKLFLFTIIFTLLFSILNIYLIVKFFEILVNL